MASFYINHYLIDESTLIETFAKLIPGSYKVIIHAVQGSISFIYVRSSKLLQPLDSPCVPFRVPEDLDVFLRSMRQIPGAKIYVESPLVFEDVTPVIRVQRMDWSKTIDDLVEHNIVTVCSSKGVMCNDPRRFRFGGGDDDDSSSEVTWWEVDCLGTGLCSDVTEKVVDEWSRVMS